MLLWCQKSGARDASLQRGRKIANLLCLAVTLPKLKSKDTAKSFFTHK